jgi:hypothetical protein
MSLLFPVPQISQFQIILMPCFEQPDKAIAITIKLLYIFSICAVAEIVQTLQHPNIFIVCAAVTENLSCTFLQGLSGSYGGQIFFFKDVPIFTHSLYAP